MFPTNRALDKTPGRFRPADFHGRGPETKFLVKTWKFLENGTQGRISKITFFHVWIASRISYRILQSEAIFLGLLGGVHAHGEKFP